MLGLNEGEEKLKKFQGSFQCQEANKATVEMLLREQLLFFGSYPSHACDHPTAGLPPRGLTLMPALNLAHCSLVIYLIKTHICASFSMALTCLAELSRKLETLNKVVCQTF